MSAHEWVFFVANGLIGPAWIAMVAFPKARFTRWLVETLAVPAVIAGIYLVLILVHFGATDGGFFTLEDVKKLFVHEGVVLAGWVHYLAFDLVVGSFIFGDARKHGVFHPFLCLCLFLTLMWGPAGFLLYRVGRSRYTREPMIAAR